MDIQGEASEIATRSLTPEEWERDVLRALLDSPGARQTYERLSMDMRYDAFLDLFVGIVGRGIKGAGATGLRGLPGRRSGAAEDEPTAKEDG